MVDLLMGSSKYTEMLRKNTDRFRSKMDAAGFTVAGMGHPICPVMLGDAKLASVFAEEMLSEYTHDSWLLLIRDLSPQYLAHLQKRTFTWSDLVIRWFQRAKLVFVSSSLPHIPMNKSIAVLMDSSKSDVNWALSIDVQFR